MKKRIQAVTVSGLLCCAMLQTGAQAGTVVEILNNNELTTVFAEGQRARINMAGADYVIVDYKNHSVKLVDPQKQQVMHMSAAGQASNTTPLVNIALKPLGPGMAIAGYPTQKFGYSANGQPCGVVYGSQQAYQASGIQQLLAAMNAVMARQREALGGFARLVDACKLADMELSLHVGTLGAPMRTEKNGRTETQIKSIKLDVALPASAFVVPAEYKTMGMGQPVKQPSEAKISASQPVSSQHRPAQPQMQQPLQRQQPAQWQQPRRGQEMMRYYPR